MQTTDNKRLQKLDKLAWLLDSSIRIPGTSRTIGLDGIVGLIPGVGDVTSGVISGYIVLQAVKTGVSGLVIARMLLNVLLESIVGVIPVFGDIFDFVFKANQRNVRLMRDYIESPNAVKNRSGFQIAIAVILGLGLIILLIYLVVKLLKIVFSIT